MAQLRQDGTEVRRRHQRLGPGGVGRKGCVDRRLHSGRGENRERKLPGVPTTTRVDSVVRAPLGGAPLGGTRPPPRAQRPVQTRLAQPRQSQGPCPTARNDTIRYDTTILFWF